MRAALRSRLMPLHETLDRAVAALCFAGPVLRMDRLLAIHASTFPVLAAVLERDGVASLWPGWDGPSRLAALAADLAELAPPALVPAALAPAAPPPPMAGAAMTGMLYVLEGSRLGNRALLHHVPAGAPTAFLRHGTENGAWPRFVAWLDAQALEGERFEEAARMGEWTFACYAAAAARVRSAQG